MPPPNRWCLERLPLGTIYRVTREFQQAEHLFACQQIVGGTIHCVRKHLSHGIGVVRIDNTSERAVVVVRHVNILPVVCTVTDSIDADASGAGNALAEPGYVNMWVSGT